MPKPMIDQDVSAIGEQIRSHRKAIGMAVKQLAEQIGVSRNTITNYENGKTAPSSGDLVKLAKVLGCGIEQLLSPTGLDDIPHFAFRAHKTLQKQPNLQISARRFFQAYKDIEEITGTRLTNRMPRIDSQHTKHINRYIAAAASKLRRHSGFAESGPENIVQVLESLGVRSLFFTISAKGLDGLSVRQNDISMVLLHQRERGIERTIFSAAHELGHLLLHPSLFTGQIDTTVDDRNYEKEANLFAGHFLVSSDELIRVWEEEKLERLLPVYALIHLKKIFKVSFWCLFERTRAENLLNITYPRLVVDLKSILRISGKAKMEELEPEPMPTGALWQSTRFLRLVQSAFLQELIGVSKVAELMQITVDQAKELTAEWMVPKSELVG